MRIASLLALTLLIASAADSQTSEPKVDCLRVELRPLLANVDDEVERADIQLSNQCGKDITAYSVRNADGSDFRVDLLPMLTMENGEILRAGATMTQTQRAVYFATQPPVVYVDAAIFLDRTAAGDSAIVSILLDHRHQRSLQYRAQYDFLTRITNYNDAQRALIGKPPDTGGAMVRYTWDQARMLLGAPEKYWNEYVEREKAGRLRLASLFQDHSTLVSP